MRKIFRKEFRLVWGLLITQCVLLASLMELTRGGGSSNEQTF
jgi:hypothetical protein